jgi:hypothetical protein
MAVVLPSRAADRTISENYTLNSDETVDGVLTVAKGVTVNLNGHNLTVGGLAGEGLIAAKTKDLTSPDPNGERVWSPTTIQAGAAKNLFNDLYPFNGATDNDRRVLVKKSNLPLVVTYDFGADSPKKVDMYKIHFGPAGLNFKERAPKAWTFEGSNDENAPTNKEAKWIKGLILVLVSYFLPFHISVLYRRAKEHFCPACSDKYVLYALEGWIFKRECGIDTKRGKGENLKNYKGA